jgi:hypothetical protein
MSLLLLFHTETGEPPITYQFVSFEDATLTVPLSFEDAALQPPLVFSGESLEPV